MSHFPLYTSKLTRKSKFNESFTAEFISYAA